MAEHTPTTDDIREDWVCDAPTPEMRAEAVATFDRWLAEVRREAAERAWDEVADYHDRTNAPDIAESTRRDNPYRKEQS